jgi:hypothetical protein
MLSEVNYQLSTINYNRVEYNLKEFLFEKLFKKYFDILQNKFTISQNELMHYLFVFLLSLPIYMVFILSVFRNIIPTDFMNVLEIYLAVIIIYCFWNVKRFHINMIAATFLVTISFFYFKDIGLDPSTKTTMFAFIATLGYFSILMWFFYCIYYQYITYEKNTVGLIMFAKKYAIEKFQSEFVASCLKVNRNATRKSLIHDINSFYDAIKIEWYGTNLSKTIGEYCEDKFKHTKCDRPVVSHTVGDFNKGFVMIHSDICLPIFEMNREIPVIYIKGLDNHITRTLDFARKSKIGTDVHGNKYIYPTTPYLNSYELELFTHADNIVSAFNPSNIKHMRLNDLIQNMNIIDKVNDCYGDFLHRIKETIDRVKSNREETEIEINLAQDIEKYNYILEIYKKVYTEKTNKTDN